MKPSSSLSLRDAAFKSDSPFLGCEQHVFDHTPPHVFFLPLLFCMRSWPLGLNMNMEKARCSGTGFLCTFCFSSYPISISLLSTRISVSLIIINPKEQT